MDQNELAGKTCQLGIDYVTFLHLLGQGGGGTAVWHVDRRQSLSQTNEAFKCFLYPREKQNEHQIRQVI